MKRVLVIGCAGAGKSTLSNAIGERFEIPVVHLDKEYWKPGWTMPSKDEWLASLSELLQRDAWVLDGNFDSSLELRMKSADTVIYLEFPRPLCLWRVFKRRLKYKNTHRPDMTPGCNEQLDLGFLKWIWNFNRDSAPYIRHCLERNSLGKEIRVLKTPQDVSRFLNELDGLS